MNLGHWDDQFLSYYFTSAKEGRRGGSKTGFVVSLKVGLSFEIYRLIYAVR